MRIVVFVVSAIIASLFLNCVGIGPGTVDRDRFDYVNAISNSWKKQMLLNLVKTRYVDSPVFMDVTSIISQYAIEGQINVGTTLRVDSILGDSYSLGGSGKYTDRPTITYSPLMGEKFTRSLMTPIPVNAFLSMIQAEYPVDYMFRICVQTINGIENQFGGEGMARSAHPDFYRLIDAMRRIQKKGALGMRVKRLEQKKTTVIFFRREYSDEMAEDIKTVWQILDLDTGVQEYNVVYGAYPNDTKEIAILTRSMLQIVIDLASAIDVPKKDVREGRVSASTFDEKAPGLPPLIRIRNGNSPPDDAFVSVKYRNNWFWIEDTDLHSKRSFTFLMMLFSLTESDAKAKAPIVTVPTD
jgi:hypothetical protein